MKSVSKRMGLIFNTIKVDMLQIVSVSLVDGVAKFNTDFHLLSLCNSVHIARTGDKADGQSFAAGNISAAEAGNS